ncbi:MAG TPA: nicotinamide-nucleotide amidohydrolase family protein, partial [candidate division Zixibacteria bacterium]|nr:nicotinamide-nucleotide amidohydrolase family protein [candidate division Zixibacteria bacterium]
ILDDKILGDIRARYKKRGIEMPSINENQALIPTGSQIFKNRLGSAAGIGIIENNFTFIALPGVPVEMKKMMDEEIIPFLTGKNFQKPTAIFTLKTNGLFESQLAEIISPELNLESGVKLAYLPGYSGVDLRVVAVGADNRIAVEKARNVVEHIESRIADYIYGRDQDTLPSVIGTLLKKSKKTITTAESCTGGELGELITTVPGSSDYYLGGIVAYANDVKVKKLNVSQETLDRHGAVSEECALEMAAGCRREFQSDYALSITGIAGPDGGTVEKPVGTTFIGYSSDQKSFARHFNFGIDREMVRARACFAALEILRRELLNIK